MKIRTMRYYTSEALHLLDATALCLFASVCYCSAIIIHMGMIFMTMVANLDYLADNWKTKFRSVYI